MAASVLPSAAATRAVESAVKSVPASAEVTMILGVLTSMPGLALKKFLSDCSNAWRLDFVVGTAVDWSGKPVAAQDWLQPSP